MQYILYVMICVHVCICLYLNLPVWLPNGSFKGSQFTIIQCFIGTSWKVSSMYRSYASSSCFKMDGICSFPFGALGLFFTNLLEKFPGDPNQHEFNSGDGDKNSHVTLREFFF